MRAAAVLSGPETSACHRRPSETPEAPRQTFSSAATTMNTAAPISSSPLLFPVEDVFELLIGYAPAVVRLEVV